LPQNTLSELRRHLARLRFVRDQIRAVEQERLRQYWGRRAAYLCQFGNPIDRAHIGRAKLKAKLCSPDLGDWRIPPKPPKMRWATYDRLIEQYLKYDAVLGGVPIQQISNA